MWAVQPKLWLDNGGITPQSLVEEYYLPHPDLTLALLTFIRKRWSGRNSKRQRIQNFLAAHTAFKVLAHNRGKWAWLATDCEIANAFQLATGEPVATEDVVKARKALAARIKRGKWKFKRPMRWVEGGQKSEKPSF